MILVKYLSFLPLFIVFETAHSESTCTHNVTECMTEGAQNVYDSLVAGIKNLIEPIDPMHIEKIDADLPGLKYHLTNITLNGLKNCSVELFKSDVISFNFELDLHCPQVVYTYNYDVKGAISTSIEIDRQGYANVDLDNFYIKTKGKFKKFISAQDQKRHIFIVSHFIETDPEGLLIFKSSERINPDKAKLDLETNAINENYKSTETLLRFSILENFMMLFVQKLNTYFVNFSVDKLFPEE